MLIVHILHALITKVTKLSRTILLYKKSNKYVLSCLCYLVIYLYYLVIKVKVSIGLLRWRDAHLKLF